MKQEYEKCLVDSTGRICGWCAGMSESEIRGYCEKHGCRIALYDTEKNTVRL